MTFKYKFLSITCFFILSINILNAQVPDYAWAKRAGGSGVESGIVTTDLSGNVFMAGHFDSPSISFDSITLNAVGADLFLVKYDVSGNTLWAQRAGDGMSTFPQDVACDSDGNVIVSGFFSGSTITFGSFILTKTAGGSAYQADIYIVKYDPSGNVLWAKNFGTSGNEEGMSVAIDLNDNIILTGYFEFNLTIGSTVLNNSGLSGTYDIFLTKLDSNGNINWVKKAGGTSNDVAQRAATDNSGNILITGYYNYSSTFESTLLTSSGYQDVFLAKYDPAGNLLWVRSIGGASDLEDSRSVTVDTQDNIIIAGEFESDSLNINSISGPLTLIRTPSGYANIFTAKYDASGNVIWAKSFNSISSRSNSIASDANNNLYVTGFFQGSGLTFAGQPLSSSPNNNEVLLLKYDSMGNEIWHKSAVGSGSDASRSVAVDPDGNLYISGNFGGTSINFDTITLLNADPLKYDLFFAKLENNCHAYYSTSYDSTANTFYLTVDPNTIASAVSYIWDFGDGSTSSQPAPSHNYTVDSVYNVCMSIYTSYGDSCSYCHLIGIDTSGNIIRNTGFSINVLGPVSTNIQSVISYNMRGFVYPNPSEGQASIRFEHQIKDARVQIFSFNGQCVLDNNFSGDQFHFDISKKAKGMYFIRVTNNETTFTTKFILN